MADQLAGDDSWLDGINDTADPDIDSIEQEAQEGVVEPSGSEPGENADPVPEEPAEPEPKASDPAQELIRQQAQELKEHRELMRQMAEQNHQQMKTLSETIAELTRPKEVPKTPEELEREQAELRERLMSDPKGVLSELLEKMSPKAPDEKDLSEKILNRFATELGYKSHEDIVTQNLIAKNFRSMPFETLADGTQRYPLAGDMKFQESMTDAEVLKEANELFGIEEGKLPADVLKNRAYYNVLYNIAAKRWKQPAKPSEQASSEQARAAAKAAGASPTSKGGTGSQNNKSGQTAVDALFDELLKVNKESSLGL